MPRLRRGRGASSARSGAPGHSSSKRDRRRLTLVAAYGVLIAGLDTIALLLLYALTTLLANETPTGITGSLLGSAPLTSNQRYHDALILLLISAGLFVARSVLSILGLWLTVGAANRAQAELVSRLLFGHARAPHLTQARPQLLGDPADDLDLGRPGRQRRRRLIGLARLEHRRHGRRPARRSCSRARSSR